MPSQYFVTFLPTRAFYSRIVFASIRLNCTFSLRRPPREAISVWPSRSLRLDRVAGKSA